MCIYVAYMSVVNGNCTTDDYLHEFETRNRFALVLRAPQIFVTKAFFIFVDVDHRGKQSLEKDSWC